MGVNKAMVEDIHLKLHHPSKTLKDTTLPIHNKVCNIIL